MFVEAHTVGADDWTTLPDLNGHTSDNTGNSCPRRLAGDPPVPRPLPDRQRRRHLHAASGTHRRVAGGDRRAATATSSGRSTCRPTKNADVELSISYASDDIVQRKRRLRRRRRGLERPGLDLVRGRRQHARRLDRARAARGQPRQRRPTGSSGTAADAPPTPASDRRRLVRPEPEIIAFSSGIFGPLPVLGRRRRSSTTSRASASRSRRRRGRSTRRTSSTPRRTATPSSSTSSRTSGPATAWRSPAGSTSGSTRASRPT